MKSTGIVRKIDELGRVVIPMEIRNTMGINSRDAMEIFVDGDKIILRKYGTSCVFCGPFCRGRRRDPLPRQNGLPRLH